VIVAKRVNQNLQKKQTGRDVVVHEEAVIEHATPAGGTATGGVVKTQKKKGAASGIVAKKEETS
jgi:hypothetical protein